MRALKRAFIRFCQGTIIAPPPPTVGHANHVLIAHFLRYLIIKEELILEIRFDDFSDSGTDDDATFLLVKAAIQYPFQQCKSMNFNWFSKYYKKQQIS